MNVGQTTPFRKAAKKLNRNQKQDLDQVVQAIVNDPAIGEMKTGDLSGVSVYKFKMNKQLALLAYQFQEEAITLLALGSHENFYRDLKKSW